MPGHLLREPLPFRRGRMYLIRGEEACRKNRSAGAPSTQRHVRKLPSVRRQQRGRVL